ncbi:MAG: phospholipase A [Gammaproteobacteria bacterium]|nr:phospholipase A [Gammaproteobacteria bacterium]
MRYKTARTLVFLLAGSTLGPALAAEDPAQEEADDRTEVVQKTENPEDEWYNPLVDVLFSGPPALGKRLEEEKKVSRRFSLLSHHPNYVLPATWTPDPRQFQTSNPDPAPPENVEIKFQISFKVPVWEAPLGDESELSVGYTQQSWWQAYNSAASKPFRETNHAPEVFMDFLSDREILGFTHRITRLGILHQSNGRSEPFSRSWDRLYAQFVLERGGFVMSLRPWYRIPESASEDDNPDITDYMGYGDIGFAWRNGENVYSLMLRNNFDLDDNRGAIQVDWSFDISEDIRGYVQIFDGYGESLIDYNESVTRIGIGIQLTGWL